MYHCHIIEGAIALVLWRGCAPQRQHIYAGFVLRSTCAVFDGSVDALIGSVSRQNRTEALLSRKGPCALKSDKSGSGPQTTVKRAIVRIGFWFYRTGVRAYPKHAVFEARSAPISRCIVCPYILGNIAKLRQHSHLRAKMPTYVWYSTLYCNYSYDCMPNQNGGANG